ncbi:MAG TPA: xanthine dehydrogenase family protein molybdopterin-binding subunit [Casimicrobiaceae bacterium]|nr:xanthine dehydrogenase family protein molybdopterin-binding subunit [Casimicrobiaceae bacterium]
MSTTIINVSRRAFLKSGTAVSAGLVLGVPALAQTASMPRTATAAAPTASTFNAFVRIGSDNTVTVISKHLEMGQGSYTGLATLIADELDAAWSQVRVEGAPADAARYNNLAWGPAQGTGGSSSIANCWDQMRQAGAVARAMLVAAAAQRWNVPTASITVRDGALQHAASKRKATFGELASAAAALPMPKDVKPKDPKDWAYIGKTFSRTDARAKGNGTAIFTQDLKLPGMLTAVVAHPPRIGARHTTIDADVLKTIPGIRQVVEIPAGVAVLATNFWSAKQGRDALKIQWDESRAFKGSSSEIFTHFRKLAEKAGSVARSDGDAEKALAGAARVVEATYEFPYLAHAAMEPLNCVMRLGNDNSVEVWNGEQFQTGDQMVIAKTLGIKPEQVKINMLFAGGSFGRRANPHADYLVECAEILVSLARAGQRNIPIKLVWTREDDMKAGFYRPAFLHTMKAGLDATGNIVGWQHRLVGQSIADGTMLAEGMIKNGVDALSVEGASNVPYAMPNVAVDLHSPKIAVPVLWWRSVGSSHTAFSTETFIDELATAAKKDPVEYRRGLLAKHPKLIAVLDLAAKEAGWTTPLAAGKPGERRGRGIAVHESFGTPVAQVVDVTISGDNNVRVDRVVCAVDCGIAVNPDNVRAQMEGGIGFGLSAALYGAITLKDGIVEQSNFHDYPILRIHEMPRIDVHIVPSTAKPTGVGEPGTPVIAPALANAIAAATGKRIRSLPIKLG